MKSWLLVTAAATLAACASTPATTDQASARVTVDPVGVFDFNTTVDGTPVNGVVTITRANGIFGGSITTNVTDPITVNTVTVEGQRVSVVANTPDGPLTFLMDFTGNDFTGTWGLGTMSGTHTGKRRTT